MQHNPHSPATVDSPAAFFNFSSGSGRWAAERFVAATRAGMGIKALSPSVLRTAEVLTRDEWKVFDTELVAEGQIRLRGVADLVAAGLVKRIPNGLAKTVLEYQTISDMDPAIVSLDGVTRSFNDRIEFGSAGIPLPITHKDFYINLRTLLASRTSGEALDTTYVRVAGRKIAETTENMLFNGGKTFGSLPIYGYTTHPNRNLMSFGSGGDWGQAAKTGAQIVTDVSGAVALLEGDRMYGPYMIYTGSDASLKLQEDYKAEGDATIRERILQLDNVQGIRVADQLADGEVVVVQMTPDVVQMVEGEPLQTVQWDVHGGFQINFKAMTIMVPLIRSDPEGRSGIVHIS